MKPHPLKTFIIYSHEDLHYRKELEKFLRYLVRKDKITIWSDKEIKAGEYWDETIKLNLAEAELILMLVSVDFYNSDYVHDMEFQRAKERHERGEVLVIPVLVRFCPWKSYDFIQDLQVLPTNAKSIDTWQSQDQAFTDVAEKIDRLVTDLLDHLAAKNNYREETAEQAREAASRKARDQRSDEAAWAAVESAEASEELEDKITAYEFYLEKGFPVHIEEAETKLRALEIERSKREIAVRIIARKENIQKSKNGQIIRDLPGMPEIVFVEEGTFNMGANENFINEWPLHAIDVKSFWISKYPVTFREYDQFCEQTGRKESDDVGWGRGNRPVVQVSWHDASEYCVWLSQKSGRRYRLLSEAEWEFAARGGNYSNNYDYSGSNTIEQVAWYDNNSNNKTQEVGKKNANELGLFDMSGNVWEWCADHWHSNYQNAPADGTAWIDNNQITSKVLRGGSACSTLSYALITRRIAMAPNLKYNLSGFRVARADDDSFLP